MNNLLVKLSSRKPTVQEQFQQQLDLMSPSELREFAGPSPTMGIDAFQEKAASAIQQGRRLAHEAGDKLLEKSAQATEDQVALVEAVSKLSDEDAIKLAEVLENGTDVEKVAMLSMLKGMAGKGLKAMGGFAAKHPTAAGAVGGAAIGAAMGGEGNRLGGALGGAAMGGLGAHMIPGAGNKIRQLGFGAGLKGQQMMTPKVAAIDELYKTAMMADCSGPASGPPSWLGQFEGTPLLEQAIGMAEAELQLEIEDIQRRQQRQEFYHADDETWQKRSILGARKRLLELQLVAQRNGLGAPQAEEQPQEQQQAPQQPQQGQQQQKPQGVGLPGGVQPPLTNQQQMPKQANAGAYAISTAIPGIGGALLGARLGGVPGAIAGGVLGGLGGMNAESRQQELLHAVKKQQGMPKQAGALDVLGKVVGKAHDALGSSVVTGRNAVQEAVATPARPLMHLSDAIDPPRSMTGHVMPYSRERHLGKAIGGGAALGGTYALGKHMGSKEKKASLPFVPRR